jgi:hypothetical protein
MADKKISMGGVLLTMDGDKIRRSAMLHRETIAAALDRFRALGLDSQTQRKIDDAANELGGGDLTLGVACVNALLGAYDDEKTLEGAQRLMRLRLAQRCNRAGMVKLSDADVLLIKKLVDKCYLGSLIAPQIHIMLDGEVFTPAPDETEDAEK